MAKEGALIRAGAVDADADVALALRGAVLKIRNAATSPKNDMNDLNVQIEGKKADLEDEKKIRVRSCN